MRLKVLGRMGRYANELGSNSCYILSTDNAKILMDIGGGNLAKVIAEDISTLSAIIITHLHADHYSDLLTLRYYIEYHNAMYKTSIHIPIYLPSSPNVDYEVINRGDVYSLNIINENTHLNIGDINLEFCKMSHPVETYGISASSEMDKIVYTADTRFFEGLSEFMQGARVVVGDACVLDKDHTNKTPHISVKQLASCMTSGQLVLSHLPDNNIEEIEIEAIKYYANSQLAEENKIY